MGATAVAAARSVNYQNAGTIEFILDPATRAYYFLEMNTRLQVEHPVTELITGLDLVQWQIKVEAGIGLPFSQSDIIKSGHAIECRLYAEDPENQFLPAAGQVIRFTHPQGPGIRIDSGITSGDVISTHYDPMIAKIIVHAADRTDAIQKMRFALRNTILFGLMSNLNFLQSVLAHPVFQEGEATTQFIKEHLPNWKHPSPELPEEALIAAILVERMSKIQGTEETEISYSPWDRTDFFRLGEGSFGRDWEE